MPFYDYKCNKCGQTFEAMHGMGARPEDLRCEYCSSNEISRVFYPVSRLSGGGGGGCSSCSSGSCGSCGH